MSVMGDWMPAMYYIKCISWFKLKNHINDEYRLTKIKCNKCNGLVARVLIDMGTH